MIPFAILDLAPVVPGNDSPLVIAKQFGTLDSLFPG